MKIRTIARASLLSAAIALTLTGCGDGPVEMSQEEILYISHLDQARFFQRQGELRASTLEARSAIELQPDQPAPYFVILENLLKAGDSENAERQLDQLIAAMAETGTEFSPANQNRASLIRAEANFYQGEFQAALEALESASFNDRQQQLKAKVLEGKIHHASGELDKARIALEEAHAIDPNAPSPLIGLSRLAFTTGDQANVTSLTTEAESLDPNDPEIWLWKAQLAQAEEDWETAEQAYIKALEDIGQFDVMTRQKYETISALISALRAQGKSSEAFVYEEILAKSGPGMVRSNLIAAQEAYNRGDINEAARHLEELLRQAPAHEQSTLMLGMIRFRQGRMDEAEKLLAPIVESTSSEEASQLLAATRIQLRDPQGAKAILDKIDNSEGNPSTTALAGIAALASGDLETGEALIEQSLQKNPENHELRLRYARYLTEINDFDRAISNSQKVINAAPENEKARMVLIQAYVRSGNLSEAIAAAEQWIKQAPPSMGAILTRGQLAIEGGSPSDASDYFKRAQEAFPESSAPLVARGNLSLSRGEADVARKHFREALKLDEENRQALAGFSRVSPRDDTINLMNQLVEKNPETIGPKLILLEAALMDGQSVRADELSSQLLERTEENVPAQAEPAVINIYSAVASRLRDDDLKKAEEILNRARALFPQSERITLQAADLAFRSGQPNEARELVQEAKQSFPESASPYLIEAAHYERQNQYQEAAELYELAQSKTDTPNVRVAQIKALQNAGLKERAVTAADSAVEAYPQNPSVLTIAAMLYQGEDQEHKAQSTYESVLEIVPNNIVALNNLAWLYHQNSDERALELAKRAYQLQPENAAIADTYGWILFKAGNVEESLPILETAHQLQPNSQEIAMHLAEAYKASGRTAEAKSLLESFGNQG
ncbi:tetratricopeptide repeat protein [Marinobacter nauticus]|uniref:tetratricopeptide repeat protein n=1 Tax=Marinobacter nauticus TaxID=2743 RepID=UPI001CD2E7BD|nr:tetratricopeptide repeat protein [Marinobacter nauticus]MCA0911858.1 tetratricopeptide repeat protein [Marinobacter nauticus]